MTKDTGPGPLPELRPPANTLSTQAADFQRDLGRYWRHVRRQGPLPFTQAGWLYKTAFKGLLAALNEPADAPAEEAGHGRAFFMRRALRALGAITINTVDELTVVADAAFLGLPTPARIRMLFELWRDGGMWHELDRIETDHSTVSHEFDAPPEMARARAGVLGAIAASAVGAGRWISFDAFAAQMQRVDPNFLFKRRANERQYPGFSSAFYNPLARTAYFGMNNAYGITFELRDIDQAWALVERRTLARMVAGPLRWMGLVDLGYEGEARAVAAHTDGAPFSAFRLTPAGAWLLGRGPAPEFAEGAGRVVTQPNFTILAMDPISDSVLIELDHFAEPRGGDRALIYELTRQSVYRGQRAGWSAARITTFLEARQNTPIPSNVRRSLEEWQQQHDRVVFVRNAPLLQYADAAARAGAVETLGDARLSTLSPSFDMILPGAPFEAVVDQLKESGWMPLVSPAGGEDHSGIARVSPDGTVTLKQAVPSMHALADLDVIAEPAGEIYSLSAARVRASMSRGVQVEQALATLANLADAPLDAETISMIRAWSSFYGQASLREVAILTLANPDVLDHAMADPAIGKLLQPVPGALQPIALVETRHLALVREMLIERGVAVAPARA